MTYGVCNLISEGDALTHHIFVPRHITSRLVTVKGCVYYTTPWDKPDVGIGMYPWLHLRITLTDKVDVEPVTYDLPCLSKVKLAVIRKRLPVIHKHNDDYQQYLTSMPVDILNVGEQIPIQLSIDRNIYLIQVIDADHSVGRLTDTTDITWVLPDGTTIIKPIFKVATNNFQKLQVGGLSSQLDIIYEKVFMSRALPEQYLVDLGLSHVKGIIMHGPPGCGKTLLARSLARDILNVPNENIQVVNGPEVLSKWYGESEEKIRQLFQPAIDNPSQLYVIIFDEIDSLARSRGSGSDSTGDKIVNQLLTKMDGVDSLSNIIIIGATNRIDLIDEALLRPNRFEVKIYVGLPSEQGRQEILTIHSRKLLDKGVITPNIIHWLAKQTDNFTGAELEAIIKMTILSVIRRQVNPDNIQAGIDTLQSTPLMLTEDNFQDTLQKFEAMFRHSAQISTAISVSTDDIIARLGVNFSRPRKIILFGVKSLGKTTFACSLLNQSIFKYTKYLSARDFVGRSVPEKVKILLNAGTRDVKDGLIILDNMEILLEFAPGCFNNTILQTILTILNDRLHTYIIIAKRYSVLEHLGLTDNVDVTLDFDNHLRG